ncbi:50S ribosomal protein L21 [Acidobacteria bacterium ACD]|nr:MAG: 50S ribosomal protein L21 [Acidobacteriota bacterium]MCE7958309.1 50S ribosomal protein L21 [Acidobacteria bacterium ACB2]MDL1948588.1 50S ribosomal protein L21 [Acidobacteria bacterium ACD]
MYAVIQTGGKQIRVEKGDVVRIERVSKETLAKGDEIALTEVLAIGREDGLHLGKPFVDGAKVSAVVVRETRGPKLLVFKKKKRKQFKRTHGHRQDLVEIRIQAIEG